MGNLQEPSKKPLKRPIPLVELKKNKLTTNNVNDLSDLFHQLSLEEEGRELFMKEDDISAFGPETIMMAARKSGNSTFEGIQLVVENNFLTVHTPSVEPTDENAEESPKGSQSSKDSLKSLNLGELPDYIEGSTDDVIRSYQKLLKFLMAETIVKSDPRAANPEETRLTQATTLDNVVKALYVDNVLFEGNENTGGAGLRANFNRETGEIEIDGSICSYLYGLHDKNSIRARISAVLRKFPELEKMLKGLKYVEFDHIEGKHFLEVLGKEYDTGVAVGVSEEIHKEFTRLRAEKAVEYSPKLTGIFGLMNAKHKLNMWIIDQMSNNLFENNSLSKEELKIIHKIAFDLLKEKVRGELKELGLNANGGLILLRSNNSIYQLTNSFTLLKGKVLKFVELGKDDLDRPDFVAEVTELLDETKVRFLYTTSTKAQLEEAGAFRSRNPIQKMMVKQCTQIEEVLHLLVQLGFNIEDPSKSFDDLPKNWNEDKQAVKHYLKELQAEPKNLLTPERLDQLGKKLKVDLFDKQNENFINRSKGFSVDNRG